MSHMFCPQCEREFSWDVMICPDCDVETVDELPREGPEPVPDARLACVFKTGDPGLISFVRSLLDSEEIDYFVRGDQLQDLVGLGRCTGYSFAMGPPEFWVREEDVERTRELLRDLGNNEDETPT